MAPSERQAIEEVSASDDVLWVKALDDVSGRLFALRRSEAGRWTSTPVDLPGNSTLHILATGADLAFVTVEGMLTPPSLHAVTTAGPASARPEPAGAVRRRPLHRRAAFRRPRATARAFPISSSAGAARRGRCRR